MVVWAAVAVAALVVFRGPLELPTRAAAAVVAGGTAWLAARGS